MIRKRSKWMLVGVAIATVLPSTMALAASGVDPNDDTLNTACPFMERGAKEFFGTGIDGKRYFYAVDEFVVHTARGQAFHDPQMEPAGSWFADCLNH